MMQRPPGWEHRLQQCVADTAALPFCYGQHDCAQFAARAIAAVTGEPVAAPLLARYRSQTGARRLVNKHGGLDKLASTVLGAPVAATYARRGDIVYQATDDGMGALGVCLGRVSVFLSADGGQVRIDTLHAACAWRVG